MTIFEKLLAVQTELKAPKNQWNGFGKYNYRSCEDILEAVKPILAKYKATLFITDTVKLIGERYYIEATANFVDVESGEKVTTTAFAREDESKKGMDGSQVTGASSSYARKYALNGLFDIDDSKDNDGANDGDKKDDPKPEEQPKKPTITPRKRLIAAIKARGIDINAYAQKHNLGPNTTDDVYEDLLIDLEADNGI